jgi:aerobic carbon-monoxide dehydrogenase small subunit
MTNSRRYTLHVNDTEHVVECDVRKTLADVLREECGLTGTRIGCEHGICGACTVIIDGAPVRSCLSFAIQEQGRKIRTVESLSKDGALHPLQQLFIKHHALQCGYCTSGFLMLVVAVAERNAPVDYDEMIDILSSNLCRCTGYRNIITAVEEFLTDQSVLTGSGDDLADG